MTAPDHLVSELHRAGVERFDVRMGGKHPRLEFVWAGRMRTVVFAGTPGDRRRGQLNERAFLRRVLRRVG